MCLFEFFGWGFLGLFVVVVVCWFFLGGFWIFWNFLFFFFFGGGGFVFSVFSYYHTLDADMTLNKFV